MSGRVKILAKLWFLYFLFTIASIGLFFCGTAYFPLQVLGLVVPAVRSWPDQVLRFGIGILMRVQPWYNARVDLTLPNKRQETPTGGVLLISNHRSHLDVFILLSRVPGIRILAKSTLFRIPGLALMMRSSKQIRVERGRLDAWVRAMDEVGLRLRGGETVHIFPEMTRCEPGFNSVQPFTAGPFLVAMKEDVWIQPVVFRNTDGVWPKGELGLRFRAPVEVLSLPPLRARDFASAEELRNEVRTRIEQAL